MKYFQLIWSLKKKYINTHKHIINGIRALISHTDLYVPFSYQHLTC